MIRFLLVCEGSSDESLTHHIEKLIIQRGLPRAGGNAWHYGRTLVAKIQQGMSFYPVFDLLFVHRDSDAGDPTSRYAEIERAAAEAEYFGPLIGVVPVRSTESWLLADESMIRQACGNRRGTVPLELPQPNFIETLPNPKEVLEAALLTASETSGRRLSNMRRRFPDMRHQMLQNLPAGGALERLSSWMRLRDDLDKALNTLRPNNPL